MSVLSSWCLSADCEGHSPDSCRCKAMQRACCCVAVVLSGTLLGSASLRSPVQPQDSEESLLTCHRWICS